MKNKANYVKAGFLPCTHECTFKSKSGYCVLNSCSYEYTRKIMKKIPYGYERTMKMEELVNEEL